MNVALHPHFNTKIQCYQFLSKQEIFIVFLPHFWLVILNIRLTFDVALQEEIFLYLQKNRVILNIVFILHLNQRLIALAN